MTQRGLPNSFGKDPIPFCSNTGSVGYRQSSVGPIMASRALRLPHRTKSCHHPRYLGNITTCARDSYPHCYLAHEIASATNSSAVYISELCVVSADDELIRSYLRSAFHNLRIRILTRCHASRLSENRCDISVILPWRRQDLINFLARVLMTTLIACCFSSYTTSLMTNSVLSRLHSICRTSSSTNLPNRPISNVISIFRIACGVSLAKICVSSRRRSTKRFCSDRVGPGWRLILCQLFSSANISISSLRINPEGWRQDESDRNVGDVVVSLFRCE
jgi:hypothetical protein